MFRGKNFQLLLPAYLLVLCGFVASAFLVSRSATVMAENAPIEGRYCVIVDAGHGGVDGGATSCTGVLESRFNLEVALRVNDLLHLLGVETKMIRTDDISIYTEGESIAAKKMSDLKERVRIVNQTPKSVLVSLHMNHFSDSQYHGPQVFYAQTDGSKALAESMQSALKTNLDPDSRRQIKRAEGIYLMQHIQQPGILIECGFISNPEEEAKLRDPAYQKKLCCVIAATTAGFLANT